MKRLLAIAPLALMLCSCTDILFPYEKPETPVPEAFRETPPADATKPVATPASADASMPAATTAEPAKANAAPAAADAAPVDANAWPDVQWWKQFNSPELTGLVEQALKNNNDIGAAVARVKQANAQVLINGAPLLPSVELDAGATHSQRGAGSTTTTSTGTGTTTGISRSGSNLNAGLSASYELDFWGKNYSALQAAQATRDASSYDAQVVRLTVTASVANVYFDLLATNARLENAQADLKAAQGLLDALNLRFKEGTASALDVAQQTTVVASQNAALPPLVLQQSKDLDALAVLLGVLPESLQASKGKLADLVVPVVPAGLPSGLLERRPDVEEAEAQLRAAHANINRARASFFPDITLTGQAGYASTALNSLFGPGGFLLSFGANLVQPIFEGGLLIGGLDLTEAQYEELAQDYHKAIIAAFSDTEDSLAAVKQNAAQHGAQKDAQTSAAQAYALSQQQFKGGIVDITSVLNTERTMRGANDALTVATLSHLQAVVGLYKSLGGGWKTGDPAK